MAWKHVGGCPDGTRQPLMRVPLRVRDPKPVKGCTPVVADPQVSKKDGTFVPETITLRDLRAKWRKDELKLSEPTLRHGNHQKDNKVAPKSSNRRHPSCRQASMTPPIPVKGIHPMRQAVEAAKTSPAMLRHSINEVKSLQLRLRDVETRVLGKLNDAYIKPTGEKCPRVGKRIKLDNVEKVTTDSTFVPYAEWCLALTRASNVKGDEEKKMNKLRVKKVLDTTFTIQDIAAKLKYPVKRLRIILDAVSEPAETSLKKLALLPSTAVFPTVPARSPPGHIPPNYATLTKLYTPPSTESKAPTVRISSHGTHPKGLTVWPMSDTLNEEGYKLWEEFLAKKIRVEDRLRREDELAYVHEKPIWISERQHMAPFVWGRDVAIDNEGRCRWANVDEVPLRKFMDSTVFNNEMVECGKQYSIWIRDFGAIASIEFGFRMTTRNVARGMFISFPTHVIYNKLVKKRLETSVRNSVEKNDTTLVQLPTATNSRVSSCGAVPKKGTDELRLTRNMSEPYDQRDICSNLLIAVNEGARERRGIRNRDEFWWLQPRDFLTNSAVICICSAVVRQAHPQLSLEYTPTMVTMDAETYYDVFGVAPPSIPLMSSWTLDKGALRITRNVTPGFGGSDTPDLAQAAGNMRCTQVSIMFLAWLEHVIELAERGDEEANCITPLAFRAIYKARKEAHDRDGKQWAMVLYETFVDDTAGIAPSYAFAIALYLIGIWVDEMGCVKQSWHKLQAGGVCDHLGNELNLREGMVGLNSTSHTFFKAYLSRGLQATTIERDELEAVLGKVESKLSLVPGSKPLTLRSRRWLYRNKVWNYDQNNRAVDKAHEFWKHDVIEGIIRPLSENPRLDLLTGFEDADPLAGHTFTDSCRHRNRNKFCGMAGVTLFYRFVIVWYRELSAEEIKFLPVHVTEAWTVVVNLHVLMFTLLTRYTPAKMCQRIDNMAAVSTFLGHRSKDPRMTDILLTKEDFCNNTRTEWHESYIPTDFNPADLPSRKKLDQLMQILIDSGYKKENIQVIDLNTEEWRSKIDTKTMSRRLIQTTRFMKDPNKSK